MHVALHRLACSAVGLRVARHRPYRVARLFQRGTQPAAHEARRTRRQHLQCMPPLVEASLRACADDPPLQSCRQPSCSSGDPRRVPTHERYHQTMRNRCANLAVRGRQRRMVCSSAADRTVSITCSMVPSRHNAGRGPGRGPAGFQAAITQSAPSCTRLNAVALAVRALSEDSTTRPSNLTPEAVVGCRHQVDMGSKTFHIRCTMTRCGPPWGL